VLIFEYHADKLCALWWFVHLTTFLLLRSLSHKRA